MTRALLAALVAAAILLAPGCGAGSDDGGVAGSLDVVASASFLADIAQNVAGERFTVDSLVPRDADLHAYEPSTRDLARLQTSDLVVLNGGGLEATLEDTLRSAAPDTTFVAASEGLSGRVPQPGEPLADDGETDPHFWLDPTLVVTYAENLRDAFAAADPAGAAEYAANADAYIAELRRLDEWIREQVATLPATDRKLVMNHVSHGYFADRYGFTIVGAVVPSVGTGESPTARQLVDLTTAIREQHVRAIFVEIDESPQLAEQLAAETGLTVVDDLRDHSLSEPDGEAPTYIAMLRYDTRRIVDALGR
jgi:ABC-type Zn uptake system ZnuABC Zn-binding protein ZnuA